MTDAFRENEREAIISRGFAMRTVKDGREVMTVKRLNLTESWLYFFAVGYDSGRRFGIQVMMLTSAAWSGLLPE